MNQQAMGAQSPPEAAEAQGCTHSCPNGSALPGSTERNTTLGKLNYLFLLIFISVYFKWNLDGTEGIGLYKTLVYTPLKVNCSPQHIQAPVSKNQLKTVPLMEICVSQASVPKPHKN